MTTMMLEVAVETLSTIHTYGGRLDGWAHSDEKLERWAAEGIRNAAKGLATLVVEGAIEETFAYTFVCLACMGDTWATREVAGRFLGAVRRLRLVAAIARHPRASRFGTLVSALKSGRFTQAQLDLARKLAAEAA